MERKIEMGQKTGMDRMAAGGRKPGLPRAGRPRKLRGGLMACLMAAACVVGLPAGLPVGLPAAGPAKAWAEDRQKITDVHLTIDSTIAAGMSGGDVRVTTGDSQYRVGGVEILNDDDDWMGGMTPRVEINLHANTGYYFASTGRSMFSFSGDDASYSSARREDDAETLVLKVRLGKLDNGDLSVTGVNWDESDGTAMWDDNSAAKHYQVRLYRDDRSVTGTRTTDENYYEFAGDITRGGDYYFEVRAVGSGSEKGDWESSDTWYVSGREADDISYGYDSDGPGGNHGYASGGPGVVGGGSYGPGGSSGGPGVAGGSSGGPGVSSSSGNHWCLDQRGWWYQFSNGTYPVNCWQFIDGKWYCFGQDAYIRCGWIEWNGKWYYTDASGAMLTNARTPDGCYVGGDGAWIQ